MTPPVWIFHCCSTVYTGITKSQLQTAIAYLHVLVYTAMSELAGIQILDWSTALVIELLQLGGNGACRDN